MKKVSIIVPIYKTEKFLRKCLDSLVNQTLEEIEIICVNDGSPDRSIDILKEYKEKYNDKIVIVDKKNEGVYKARFSGIEVARGEYIAFVDSDDYVNVEYAEKLYEASKKSNSDITVCAFVRMDMYTSHVYSKEMNQYGGKMIDMNKNPEDIITINGAPWNKLYRTSLLKKLKPTEVIPPIFEDMILALLIYLEAEKIYFINDILYNYMVRSGSIMTSINQSQIKKTEAAMIEVKNRYKDHIKGKKLLEIVDSMAFLHLGISLMLSISNDKNCNFKQELKNNRKFLNNNFSTWKKTRYLKILYTLKHKCNFKIAVMKKIYLMHLLRPFLFVYKFMINVLKIDIKW